MLVPSSSMFATGSQIGRYKVRSRLGAGGMGEVFLAVDTNLERLVAIKVLPEALATDPMLVSRFVQEARAASALNHPGILTVFDFGQDGDTRYLVTEFVDGVTLREWVAAERRSVAELVGVVAQAAAALAAAHAAGIVHRDVKPENLMVRGDGLVKVLDFGLAKLLATSPSAPEHQVRTTSGLVVGTVRYMSPEQANGEAVDARTDVWSLGVVLYELLAGRPPFEGDSPMVTLGAIMLREPEPLDRIAPGLPEALYRIVARALAKARDDRLESAAEMARALSRLASEAGGDVGDGARDGAGTASHRPEVDESRRALPTTNLPARASGLIGRERELAELCAMLRRSGVRLVTVTGAGGTGKTRLAVETARFVLGDFVDGALVVDLTTISDPGLLANRIAQVCGVQEGPGAPIARELERYFSTKRLLLLLDNFEHLLDGAPYVAGLLAAAPGLTVLVTSRALLHLSHEREYPLEPLEVPAFSSLPPLDELARTPAVALFVERAREARPSFAITAENAGAVVEICRRLDGLPLALELAAARVKVLQPAALLERLDRRLKILTGGAKDLPSRQQTMRGAVAWSYDLLDDAERTLLRWLAVFVGGSTIEAAEAVCASCELDVLDAVGSLVDKSLLRRRELEDGEMRFMMLEVVREYALEQLEASGEAGDARLAHARYFGALAEQANEKIRGTEQAVWLDRLAHEHDNIRTALATLFDREPGEGVTFVIAAYVYWYFRGHYSEARGWLSKALEASASPPVRARVLGQLSQIELRLGDRGAAARARETVEASRATDDPRLVMSALGVLGFALVLVEDVAGARQAFEEALPLAREIGDTFRVAALLGSLGDVARIAGDFGASRDYLEQALEVAGPDLRNHDNAIIRLNLGSLSLMEGDYAGAEPYFRDALSIARELGNPLIGASVLESMAEIALVGGDAARAARLSGAAEAFRDATGAPLDFQEVERYNGFRARLGEALEAAPLARERARGAAMSLDDAAREALGDE